MNEPVSFVIVQTTVATEDDAKRLANELVTRRLAACVQYEAIRSVYRWKNAVEQADEYRLSCKTTLRQSGVLMETLRTMHPYELPELISIPLLHGSSAYLNWLAMEVNDERDVQDAR